MLAYGFLCPVVMGLLQEPLDSHFPFSDPVDVKPMHFRKANRSTIQTNCGGAFQRFPTTRAVFEGQSIGKGPWCVKEKQGTGYEGLGVRGD